MGAAGVLEPLQTEGVSLALLQGDLLGGLLLIPLVDPPVKDALVIDVQADAVVGIDVEGVGAILGSSDAAGPGSGNCVRCACLGSDGALHVGGGDVGLNIGAPVVAVGQVVGVEQVVVSTQAVAAQLGEHDFAHGSLFVAEGDGCQLVGGQDLGVDTDVVHLAVQAGIGPDVVGADADLGAGLGDQILQGAAQLAAGDQLAVQIDLSAVSAFGVDHAGPVAGIDDGAFGSVDTLFGVVVDLGGAGQTNTLVVAGGIGAPVGQNHVVLLVRTGCQQTGEHLCVIDQLEVHDDGDLVVLGEDLVGQQQALGVAAGDAFVGQAQNIALGLGVSSDGAAVEDGGVVAVAGSIGDGGAGNGLKVVMSDQRQCFGLGGIGQLIGGQSVVINRNGVDLCIQRGVGPEAGHTDSQLSAFNAQHVSDGVHAVSVAVQLAVHIQADIAVVVDIGQLDPLAHIAVEAGGGVGGVIGPDAVSTDGISIVVVAEHSSGQLRVEAVLFVAQHTDDVVAGIGVADAGGHIEPDMAAGAMGIGIHDQGEALSVLQAVHGDLNAVGAGVPLLAGVVQLQNGAAVSVFHEGSGFAADKLSGIAVAGGVGQVAVELIVSHGSLVVLHLSGSSAVDLQALDSAVHCLIIGIEDEGTADLDHTGLGGGDGGDTVVGSAVNDQLAVDEQLGVAAGGAGDLDIGPDLGLQDADHLVGGGGAQAVLAPQLVDNDEVGVVPVGLGGVDGADILISTGADQSGGAGGGVQQDIHLG